MSVSINFVKILADGGSGGELIDKTRTDFGRIPEVTLRKDDSLKFIVITKRWIVEREFAWFKSYIKLSEILYIIPTPERI